MKPVLTREQMRAFDRDATEVGCVPGLLLMENAGRGATEVILDVLGAQTNREGLVLIVCGAGNNGGDGLVVARRLGTLGVAVRVVLTAPRDRLRGDARVNADAWVGLGGFLTELTEPAQLAALERELESAVLVVDALFGTGLDRPVSGLVAEVLRRLDAAAAPIVAIDIPSGLDANTGAVLGVAPRCAATVTFAHLKCGLLSTTAAGLTGRVHVVDIGVPPERVERTGWRATLLEPDDVREWLRPRSPTTHKGQAGRVVAIAGSPGKTGAALLVARGALRAGAGLVTIASHPDAAASIAARVLEEMSTPLDPLDPAAGLKSLLSGVGAVALGPGLGTGAWAEPLVREVALRHPGPVVVDADALTVVASMADELPEAAGPRLLTPHPGEMARLLSTSVEVVEADRFSAVERCCERTGAVVLLKGPHTMVGSPGVLPTVVSTVAPALATGGAGDVLTGVCAALACHLPIREAAMAASFLHGRAAVRWMDECGADRGLLAHEVADGIPAAIASLLAGDQNNKQVVCCSKSTT